MTLAKLAEQATQPSIPWRTCAVCHVTARLDAKTAADLDTLLATDVTNAQLASALTDEGHGHVKAHSVARHRRGACENGKAYRP